MTLRRSALPRPGRLVPVPRRHGDRDDGKEERDPKPFLSSTPMLAAISTKRLAYFDEGLGEVLM
jgi:hypothetical protein